MPYKIKEGPAIKRNLELEALLEVSRALTSSFDLEDVLSSAMNTLGGRLDMKRGCVFLIEPSTNELKIVAAHGLNKEEIKRGKYRLGEGIVGSVIENKTPVFVPDIGEEPKFLNRTGSRPDKKGISYISVPIELNGKALGAISVDRIYADSRGDVEDDLRVLGIVASLIAQFVSLWHSYNEVKDEKERLKVQLRDRYNAENIIGESEKLQAVIKSSLKAADTGVTVLLLGESGTGKGLLARTIHFQSGRSKGPFVAVNCAALPENLIEAELFGAEKGAFTGATSRRIGRFELAGGGSIFLDEIGELNVGAQAKLLRVLEERTFERLGSSKPIRADVRVIAATNRDLLAEVRRGNFREDLYWRLSVLPIVMPPLRERRPDIPLIVGHYLEEFNVAYGKNIRLSEDAIETMMLYKWPGNVRELANTLERLVIMSEGGVIESDDLPEPMSSAKGLIADFSCEPPARSSLTSEVVCLERERILRALKENDFIQHRAARALGITARQLGYRIKKYDIPAGTRGIARGD